MARALGCVALAATTACGTHADVGSVEALPSGTVGPNTLALSVTLDRDCARPGEEVAASITTVPRARVTLIATFPAGGSRTDHEETLADPDGRAAWEWRVGTTARLGPAALVVSAKRGDKEGSFVAPYRIATEC